MEASRPPLGYQWFHRGQSLAGATNTTLSLPNIARAQGGAYSVVITNLNGSTNSSNAVVRVLAPTLFLPPEFAVGTPLRLLSQRPATVVSSRGSQRRAAARLFSPLLQSRDLVRQVRL